MSIDRKKLDAALDLILAHGPAKKRPAKVKKPRKSAKNKTAKQLER